MALIDQCVVKWTGFSGAPGFSVFYATPGGDFSNKLQTFFTSIANKLPPVVKINVPTSGFTLEDSTGTATDTWTSTPTHATITGSGDAPYVAAAGVCVNWITPDLNPKGHRVKGRTFLVPVSQSNYDADGTIHPLPLGQWLTASQQLVDDGLGHFVIWHRPSGPGASDGSSHPVEQRVVNDRFAVLTSRRA